MVTRLQNFVSGFAIFLAASALSGAAFAPAFADDTDQCQPQPMGGTAVSISLANGDAPATDLVYRGNAQNPEQALALKQAGVDLSTLDPNATTDIWHGPSSIADTAVDQRLPVNDWDTIAYQSSICSAYGTYRFNAQTMNPAAGTTAQTVTIMMSVDLHTFLLRKELLRRLGYVIPAMKYLGNVKVQFPDVATRDRVLDTLIVEATTGTAKRWCSVAAETLQANPKIPCNGVSGMTGNDLSPNVVWFQDVVVTDATPLIYNVAIAPPGVQIPGQSAFEPETLRTLRALSVAYDLVDAPESMNLFDWYAANVQSGAVTFNLQTLANFAVTLDDALWIQRKISALSRDDLTAIVAAAQYPAPIAQLLVEKLAARRNSLNAAFGLKVDKLPVNSTITVGTAIVKGKVIQKIWPGYADQFAFDDPPSPLRGLPWFFASLGEGNALENLVDYANSELPARNATAAETQNLQNLVQQAFTKYLQTGLTQSVPVGVYFSSIASAGLQVSRNIVMGEYLGTNLPVQLADSFGVQATAGLIVGVNGLPSDASVQGMVEGSGSISVTHLTPLTSMKQAATTPISKLLVPLVFADASDIFSQIATLQKSQPNATPAQLNAALSKDVNSLSNYLKPGESLILTESLTGLAQLSAAVLKNIPGAPTLEGSVGVDEIVLSRVHISREAAPNDNVIQVFKDNGELTGLQLALEFTIGTDVAAFPVLTVSSQHTVGSASSSVYTVNILPDAQKNPGIFPAAAALKAVLRTGSMEALEQIQTPEKVAVKFNDTLNSTQFFFFVHRSLKSSATIQAELSDGSKGTYLALSDGAQTGDSFQSFATQAATFLVQQLAKSSTFVVDAQTAPDPGLSFLGKSHTRQVAFQAALSPGLTLPYFQTQYRWEGWSMSPGELQKLVDGLSAKYGFKLYPDGFMGSMTKIQLYDLSFVISVYQAGINRLAGMSAADIANFENTIGKPNDCADYIPLPSHLSPAETYNCGLLNDFDLHIGNYRTETDPKKKGTELMTALSDLEQLLTFKQFTQLMGGIQNIYVSSQITGFRVGTETLSSPINSNTIGRPDPFTPSGIIPYLEGKFGIDEGEFQMEWIRSVL